MQFDWGSNQLPAGSSNSTKANGSGSDGNMQKSEPVEIARHRHGGADLWLNISRRICI